MSVNRLKDILRYSGKNTTQVPSPPPHLHSNHKLKKNKSKEQEPAVEKSEKEILKPPTNKPVQIINDSTVGDDESIWDEGDQPTTSYNIARKLSSVEEDANKGDGIDYNALEEYTTEEKISAKKDEGNYHLLPSSIDVKQNKDRQNEIRVLRGMYKLTSLPDGRE
ncbi:unnamed protein product [Rhizophagus irregularis]|nr:unnamed protein product [Rhizophagus irregularis]